MFKKIIFLFSIIMLIPLFGFGCKGLSSVEQQATKPVTLEYWTVFDDVDALQAEVAKYKAERPYITVNIRQLRADELYSRVVEALAEDKGPDIISVQNRSIRQYQNKLATMPPGVRDTTVLVQQSKLGTNTTVTTKSRSLVTPNQIEREYVQAVKNDVVIDGKIYGLPLSLDTMALYYNKDLLDRAGVPEPPKTWDEFAVAAKKATKYDKKTGRILQSGAALGAGSNVPGADDLLFILFKQSGIDFTAKSGYAVFGNGSEESGSAMSVLDFYSDFANVTRDTYTWNEDMDNALNKFVNGSLVFFFGYSYHYPVIKARAPQLNVEVIPFLQLNPDQPINAANYWVQTVTQKSKNANEAWALIDYLAHSRATKEYLDATNRPTALRAYINEQSQKPELAPFVSNVLVAENWYHGKDYAAATKAINDMLHEWLQVPTNPERMNEWRQQVLQRAAAKINQTL